MKHFCSRFLIGGFDNSPVWASVAIVSLEHINHTGKFMFTCSFDKGEAFNIDLDKEYLRDYYLDYYDNLDAETKLEHCLNDGKKTKDNWIDEQIYHVKRNYRDIKDCSCTDLEIILYNGEIINFESTCGGQYDIRDAKNFDEFIFTDKEKVMRLLEIWENFHLQQIDDTIYEEVKEICKSLEEINEKKFIKEKIIFEPSIR